MYCCVALSLRKRRNRYMGSKKHLYCAGSHADNEYRTTITTILRTTSAHLHQNYSLQRDGAVPYVLNTCSSTPTEELIMPTSPNCILLKLAHPRPPTCLVCAFRCRLCVQSNLLRFQCGSNATSRQFLATRNKNVRRRKDTLVHLVLPRPNCMTTPSTPAPSTSHPPVVNAPSVRLWRWWLYPAHLHGR